MNQFDHFNNASSSIKFTYETTEETSNIKFMDTTTHISTAGVISHELFMKPCHSGLIADYTSAVPQQQKLSVALSEFLRAARLSSNGETRRRSEQKVIDILEYNHCPHEISDQAKERASRPRQNTTGQRSSDYRTTLKLPFKIDTIHQQVQRLIRRYKLPAQNIYSNMGLRSRICKSGLVSQPCRKYVDPALPKR